MIEQDNRYEEQESPKRAAICYDEVRHPFGLREILGFVRPGDVVLDGGCGTGQHARYVATVAGQVVGIDTDAARIAIAKMHCRDMDNTHFEVASVTQLPFEDNSFDVVLLAQVLHHLKGCDTSKSDVLRRQCKQSLMEAKRLLRVRGRLILVTTSREQRRTAYWHFNLFPQSAWERLDPCWSLTEDSWFTSMVQQLAFVEIGSAAPSESHWFDTYAELMVRRGLDSGWRSTDVAFSLLSSAELDQFINRVNTILATGIAGDLMKAVRFGRTSHGEATVRAYEVLP
uniref:Methyltransferase domain-containing protein n=1 Tax=Candidatus Kentrum sp. LFY TaxID=2126342 RepID=A0A450UBP8_9GAMM|nr:MAG: Methyltransferase domain-containing protein [Candidatus Kentron sp. LFY]